MPANEGGPACTRKYINYLASGCVKVLEVGRYMSGDVPRTAAETGASPWGLADLGGNVWEIAFNSSYVAAVPLSGTGSITWPASWPTPMAGATTYGIRGGGYGIASTFSRVSDRFNAAYANSLRSGNIGARGVRLP